MRPKVGWKASVKHDQVGHQDDGQAPKALKRDRRLAAPGGPSGDVRSARNAPICACANPRGEGVLPVVSAPPRGGSDGRHGALASGVAAVDWVRAI